MKFIFNLKLLIIVFLLYSCSSTKLIQEDGGKKSMSRVHLMVAKNISTVFSDASEYCDDESLNLKVIEYPDPSMGENKRYRIIFMCVDNNI